MSLSGRVLVVIQDDHERAELAKVISGLGHTAFSEGSVDKLLAYLDQNIDVVLCDLQFDPGPEFDLIRLWKRRSPQSAFILVTSQGRSSAGIDAIKAGAHHYLTRPVEHGDLALVVGNEIAANREPREPSISPPRFDRIIGHGPQMQRVFSRIRKVAKVDTTVLIVGENGTGKELVAHALHENSPRNKGPFVAINVAAVPATLVESELFGHVRGAFTGATDPRIGRFEQADGGTLFIDEIGDFDIALQPKLLRVLETLHVCPVGGHADRKVDVRVIAATNRDLREMIKHGTFRDDLYYRLNVVQIPIPPLRQRTEDIPILVEHFLEKLSQRRGEPPRQVLPEVMSRLISYSWPGNIRELQNTIESMLVFSTGQVLTERDLPSHIAP
ncbi:MAG: sigma-54 dependent transcriptional regulator [Tepidisphaeraceae bacterium]|jgi:DNA-binding NtrC family response regulator